MRISELPEAKEVLIELGEHFSDVDNLKRRSWYVVGGIEAFLTSVARRAKYEFFLGRVVAKDRVGFFSKQIAYDESDTGCDTPYRVINTVPDGEVQITLKTNIIVSLTKFEK